MLSRERVKELWRLAMNIAAGKLVTSIREGYLPNFQHPENATLPETFAALLQAELDRPAERGEQGRDAPNSQP